MSENERFLITDSSGAIESMVGFAECLPDAQRRAEEHAAWSGIGIHERLSWQQFSPTTWGLMIGQVYTKVLISQVPGRAS